MAARNPAMRMRKIMMTASFSSPGIITTTTTTAAAAATSASPWSSSPSSSSAAAAASLSTAPRRWSSLAARSRPPPFLPLSSSSSSSILRGGHRDDDDDDDDHRAHRRGAGGGTRLPSSFQRRRFARDRGGRGSRAGRLPRGSGGFGGRDDVDVNGRPDDGGGKFDEHFFDRDDRAVASRFSAAGGAIGDDAERRRPRSEGKKAVLVVGSSGALGAALASHFSGKACGGWDVLGADVVPPPPPSPGDGGGRLREYVRLPASGTLSDLAAELHRGVSAYVGGGRGGGTSPPPALLDAIVVASGGWEGDPAVDDYEDEEGYARRSAEVCERMMRANYFPVVAGELVGRRFLKRGGLFVMIGASAALSPTPGMLGYGSAKSAAHHYLRSLGGPDARDAKDVTAVGVLPLMLDTPANRAALDNDGGRDGDGEERSKYSKMVKPMHIANEIGEWIKHPRLRPHSGSLVKVIAKNRKDGSGGAAFHLVR